MKRLYDHVDAHHSLRRCADRIGSDRTLCFRQTLFVVTHELSVHRTFHGVFIANVRPRLAVAGTVQSNGKKSFALDTLFVQKKGRKLSFRMQRLRSEMILLK